MNDDGEGGLDALQARLEGAAAEVNATATAIRNRNKFKILDEIMEMTRRRQNAGIL